MTAQSETQKKPLTLIQSYYIAQQQTSELPCPYIPAPLSSLEQTPTAQMPTVDTLAPQKKKTLRIIAIVLAVILALVIYIIWRPATNNTTPGFASFSSTITSTKTDTSTNTSNGIQVYITGAIQHPGVYTLASGARVYQLLRIAGGPLPHANLAIINMAARLSDGGEFYVAFIGETPPITTTINPGTVNTSSAGGNSAQIVNINNATTDELRQQLPISSKTAQNIVNYRLQHGPFTSVDELTQVLSKAIYTKIKDMVTV